MAVDTACPADHHGMQVNRVYYSKSCLSNHKIGEDDIIAYRTEEEGYKQLEVKGQLEQKRTSQKIKGCISEL